MVNKRSRSSTLARDKKMASTYIFGTVYLSDHAFGNWTVDLRRGKLKGHREGMKHHRPIFHWTSCMFLRASLLHQNPLLLFGGRAETELRTEHVLMADPFSWASIPPRDFLKRKKKGWGVRRNLFPNQGLI